MIDLSCRGTRVRSFQNMSTLPRPALIAASPAMVSDGLRDYGITVRRLVLQEGPEILPAVEPPMLLDLAGQSLADSARLLLAVHARQRHNGIIPHLLVAGAAIGQQRLIAGLPALRAAILDRADMATLAAWLWAPLDLAPGQAWVNLIQPAPLTKRPYLTPLLAALDGATSVPQAAQRCAIAEATAYAILHECCGALEGRRAAAEWRARLEDAINADGIAPL